MLKVVLKIRSITINWSRTIYVEKIYCWTLIVLCQPTMLIQHYFPSYHLLYKRTLHKCCNWWKSHWVYRNRFIWKFNIFYKLLNDFRAYISLLRKKISLLLKDRYNNWRTLTQEIDLQTNISSKLSQFFCPTLISRFFHLIFSAF